jgi:L-alanine-DL-glutamate epimerase-like enolase superfamily enzyme
LKIVDVKVTLFAWENLEDSAYHGPAIQGKETNLGLVEVITDDGFVGEAFLGSHMKPASIDADNLLRWIKPILLEKDPRNREAINVLLHQVARLTGLRCIGAVDVALWDLGAKIANMPLHQFLGGYRSSIRAYASSQRLPSEAAYIEQALQLKEKGWTAYKIHPPMDPTKDIQVCGAVRAALGDDYRLMLDSTWAYDFIDGMRVGRAIEEMDYYWFEDPLADNDIHNYVTMREKLKIPIMATEYPVGSLRDYPIWITQRATDFLRGDIPNKGGITTMMKTAHLAEAFGMRYEIHHSGNSLNNLANLHVSVALRNCEMFEVLQPDGSHKFGLLKELEIDKNGLIHAPEGSGLGAQIDYELIKSKTIQVLN